MLMYPEGTSDLQDDLCRNQSPEKINDPICEILKEEDVSSRIEYEL